MPTDGGAAPTRQAQQFSVPDIHCAACIGKIEKRLNTLVGVQTARVNLSLKRLSVTGTVDGQKVLDALSGIGVQAYTLDTDALTAPQDSKGRDLLMRMAVAGFAMMNVMLLSVAIWSGASDATRDLFHLISACIAVPVVAYSAQPFFKSAWSALRVRGLNMDVPISLAIVLAVGMSLFETLQGGQHAYFDAAISLTFFLLIGRYLDYKTRSDARSAAKELTALEVHTAQRVQGGMVQSVPVSKLVVGDTVLIPSGGRVPVDGTLLSPSALMDRSFLTGESHAIDLVETAVLQAGEINLADPIEMRATAVGQDTSLRRMAALVETAEHSRNSYTALADKAAQVYAPVVHLLALAAFVVWFALTGDVRYALNIAIAVLIITCPCALGLAVPAVATAAISRLFSEGFLVKHATALERIAEVDYVVYDKTGTLTMPKVTVSGTLDDVQRSLALALAQASYHPWSRALVAALGGTKPAPLTDVRENTGQGVSANWDGWSVRLGRGSWLGASFDGLGLQVGDADAVQIDGSEMLREGALAMVSNMALPSEIVTGDADRAANIVAQDLRLPVTAGARPEDKLHRLEHLAADGQKVLMVGDGLNDTAALASAHASLAPASALEASRNAADIVLLNPDLSNVPLILKVAKATRDLSNQNFVIAALYNCVAIPIALFGFATPLVAALAMSTSSVTVLANSFRMRNVK